MNHLAQLLIGFFNRQNKTFLIVTGITSILLLGIVDYVTGVEISVSLFYLVPIYFVTWYVGLSAGMIASGLSVFTWFLADYLAGQTFVNIAILFWNIFIRSGFFIIFTLLTLRIRTLINYERTISRKDFLTGVYNSRAFSEIATLEIFRMRRYDHPFTVVYIDVDDFKAINDRLGHSSGDRVLKWVAETLVGNLRSADCVARLGGDEFAILLPETNAGAAQQATEKIIRAFKNCTPQGHGPVTLSAGVVTFLSAPPDSDTLIKIADNMMYSAKNTGKNTIRYFIYSSNEE